MYKGLFVTAATVVAVASMVGLTSVSATQGGTSKDENGEAKVTICHRTDAVNNPYVRITVSVSAADGEGHDDHSSHTGPVASSLEVATALKQSHTKWGDIISAYPGYAGYNLENGGQAVLNNGCKYPAIAAPARVVVEHTSKTDCVPKKPASPAVPTQTPAHTASKSAVVEVSTPVAPAVAVPTEAALPTALPHTGSDGTRVGATALSLATMAYAVASFIMKRRSAQSSSL